MNMPPADPSPAHFVSKPDRISRPRKVTARLIRATGLLLGAALTLTYWFIAWVSPPDMSHASPRSALNFYLAGPLLLFCGPLLLAGWIASRIERQKPTD